MATKSHILAEIRRTAEKNGGVPLGRQRFYADTGIKESDWLGRYWARWGDAVTEAGLRPNTLQVAYDEDVLFERLAALAKDLGRFPARTEIQLKAQSEPTFPNAKTFQRLGRKGELAARLATYCAGRVGYEDVVAFCKAVPEKTPEASKTVDSAPDTFGSVYLLKSGRYYKVGRSNAVGRRERELAIQLPERLRWSTRCKRTILSASSSTGTAGLRRGGRTASGSS